MRSSKRGFNWLGLAGLVALAAGCEVSVSSGDGDDSPLEGRARGSGGQTTDEDGGEGGELPPATGGEAGTVPVDVGVEVTGLVKVTINSSARTGEVALSGQLGIVEGQLAFVLSSIKDPEDATRPADSDRIGFTMTVDGEPVDCEVGPTSDTQMAPVDVVFVNDTTASMSGTVNGIADSISEFASSVAERGVDARFSMITYGDEFSTLSAGETAYSIGQGEFTASELDSSSRPYVDLVDLDRFEEFLAEVRASDDLGAGGGDGPENTLGALRYALDSLSFRPGAARVLVAIGDNPAHTLDPDDSFTPTLAEHFRPPAVDDLLSALDGTAVVHVVAHDEDREPFYNLKGLSDATGGAFIDLPADGVVDLTSTALNNWVGSTYFGVCFDVAPGDRIFEIAATVTGEAVHEGAVTYDVTLE